MRDLQLPGRSLLRATNGVCATSHPLAAEAGVEVMRGGGNAVDAALAATAVLCVVEPFSVGVGGDCFILAGKEGGGVWGLNGSGRAALGADAGEMRGRGLGSVPVRGVEAVTTPCAVDGWLRALEDYGTMEAGRVFETAIRLAREGFAVTSRAAWEWGRLTGFLDEDARRHYMKGGRAPREGEVMASPGMERVFSLIGERGREGFYEGEVGEEILKKLEDLGGKHTMEDLDGARSDYDSPVGVHYGGAEILELPPNGQGITALMMLNMMEALGTRRYGAMSVERWHAMVEASRIAYGMRDKWVADAEISPAPLEELLSARAAGEWALSVDMGRAQPEMGSTGRWGSDTVYVSAADKDGLAVSCISSLYMGFGTGKATQGNGILLQNRGACFSLEEGHANELCGGKRPLHTIIPGLARDEGGRVWSAFGVMGGDYQPMGHASVLGNVLDYEMDWQEALDAPRMAAFGGAVEMERGFRREMWNGMGLKGHELRMASAPLGGGQAAGFDYEGGTLFGASDPRKDGAAVGYLTGYLRVIWGVVRDIGVGF